MDYFIGVDIGTTSTKVVAFSADGRILASANRGYPLLHPQPGFSEQDPELIFSAVLDGLAALIAQLSKHTPSLVSFSAPMHSLIALDTTGKALTACITWADGRAAGIAERLHANGLARSFYEATGVPVHAMSPFCKICWFREKQPGIFEAASKFVGIKEFIFSRLFGEYAVDTSVASATGLMNIRNLQWHSPALDYAGIRQEQLGFLVAPTTVFKLRPESEYATGALSVLSHTPFIIGGSDGALSNLGSGATGSHKMAVTIGTSSAARIEGNNVYTDPAMRTFCYHLNGTQYVTGGAGNNGAILLQWIHEELLKAAIPLKDILREAGDIEPGSDGLLVLPYLLGERAPVWNAHAKAVFFGMTIRHTRAHLVHAAMEAIIYNIYGTGRVLMEQTSINEIYATGGFTQTPAWVQLLADVFNRPVFVHDGVENVALGAVMLGQTSLGLPFFPAGKQVAHYHPNASAHAVHLRGVEKMERLYGLLKEEMNG